MNPQNFAQELYNNCNSSKEGAKHSLKIAQRNMEASNPKNWADLPVGPVFATKGYGSDKWNLKTRELSKTHEFWKHVYNILKKKF